MISAIIVEDDPMVSELDRQYLTRSSSLIQLTAQFSNCQDAWEYITKNPVDLVVLDVYLPSCNGLDFLQQIRKEHLPIDVIMVTAARSRDEINRAFRLGAIDYLVKPFVFARFQQAIQNFLRKHDLLNSQQPFDQSMIDQLNNNDLAQEGLQPLPKGLQQQTLSRIWNLIFQRPSSPFTCKVFAQEVGLSIVTTQRYLNYLVTQGRLKTDIDYHTGGRPKMLYEVVKK